MNILEIKNLSKKYQTKTSEIQAINNININIKENEFIAIVGSSGCGKSTLIGIIAGLINDYSGEYKYNKKNITLGYMFQNDNLFDWLTVYENCILGLKIQNKINKKNISYIDNLLNEYGLEKYKNNYPSNLSGGMKQRVALIRTLAIKPDILLLDEPFSALDYQTRLQISKDVYNEVKKGNKTTIMITHDIEEAISLADRIIVLTKNPGKIKNIYEIKHIKENPIEFRNTQAFRDYISLIWKDIDFNVTWKKNIFKKIKKR